MFFIVLETSSTISEPLNIFVPGIMPKPFLVLLIVTITVLVFGVWIPADFYRFRQKKKECREKQQRIQMIKRIGPMHVKLLTEPCVEMGEEPPRSTVKFGISSIIAFFKFAKKGRHKRQSVHHQGGGNIGTAELGATSDIANSPSEPSTSATPLSIIQERNYESTNDTPALTVITSGNSNPDAVNDDTSDHVVHNAIEPHNTIFVKPKSPVLSSQNDLKYVKSPSSSEFGDHCNYPTRSVGHGLSKSLSENNWQRAKSNKDIMSENRNISDSFVRSSTHPGSAQKVKACGEGVAPSQSQSSFKSSLAPSGDQNTSRSPRATLPPLSGKSNME